LRLSFLFAPLRETYSSFGDISRKGAKIYLSRKENQLRARTAKRRREIPFRAKITLEQESTARYRRRF
jgi:hypothetical protein